MELVKGDDGKFYAVKQENEITLEQIESRIEFHRQQMENHQMMRATMLHLDGADVDADLESTEEIQASVPEVEQSAAQTEPTKINIVQITDVEPAEQPKPAEQTFVG